MRDGTETTSSSSSSPALDCDVGLGLRMQLQNYPSQPYSKPMDLNLYRYGRQLAAASDRNANFTTYGSGGSGGDGTFFTITGNQVAFVGGGMGKALFTSSQWQELERQNMIHKYIMASVPVPPQLLLPTSTNTNSPPLSLSQSNSNGVDLRFSSNGTDAEPWRCKRTDGKKWRCSRDVAPEHKYCERHAHKTRPRSRKHVEAAVSSSSHNNNNNNNNSNHPLPTTTTASPYFNTLQRSTSQFPTMAPSSTTTSTAPSYDQTRCFEWFMRGGTTIPVSTCNSSKQQQQQQQWQQLMQTSSSSSSSRLELMKNKDNSTEEHDNNNTYQQGCLMSLNPYIPEPISNHHHQHQQQQQQLSHGNSILDKKIASLPETQATRHFFDAWGKDGFDHDDIGISSSRVLSESLLNKFTPSSSLTLSMSGGNGIGEDNNTTNRHNNESNDQLLGISSDGILRPHWMNHHHHHVSWMNMNMNMNSSNSTPGGPLGEALCSGNYASVTRGATNLTSPHHNHGYSNSNNTNSSSCSEDGSNALNFIG